MAAIVAPRLAAQPSGPRAQVYRPVTGWNVGTVAPAPGIQCWICREERPARGDRFVHACSCSLVACESCLLSWVNTTLMRNGTKRGVLCPQCQMPVRVVQPLDTVLNAMNTVSQAWYMTATPLATVGICAGALVAVSSFTRLALNAFLGSRVVTAMFPIALPIDVPMLAYTLCSLPLDWVLPWVPSKDTNEAAAARLAFLVLGSIWQSRNPVMWPSIGGLDRHAPLGLLAHLGLRMATRGIEALIWPLAEKEAAQQEEHGRNQVSLVDVVTKTRNILVAPFIAQAGGYGLLRLTHALGDPWHLRTLLGLTDNRQYAAALGYRLVPVVAQTTSRLSSLFSSPVVAPLIETVEDPVWIRNFVAAELIIFVQRIFETIRKRKAYRQRRYRRVQGTPMAQTAVA